MLVMIVHIFIWHNRVKGTNKNLLNKNIFCPKNYLFFGIKFVLHIRILFKCVYEYVHDFVCHIHILNILNSLKEFILFFYICNHTIKVNRIFRSLLQKNTMKGL